MKAQSVGLKVLDGSKQGRKQGNKEGNFLISFCRRMQGNTISGPCSGFPSQLNIKCAPPKTNYRARPWGQSFDR